MAGHHDEVGGLGGARQRAIDLQALAPLEGELIPQHWRLGGDLDGREVARQGVEELPVGRRRGGVFGVDHLRQRQPRGVPKAAHEVAILGHQAGELPQELRRRDVGTEIGDQDEIEAARLEVIEDGGAEPQRRSGELLLGRLHGLEISVGRHHQPSAAGDEELRRLALGRRDGTDLEHPAAGVEALGEDVPGQELALPQATEGR